MTNSYMDTSIHIIRKLLHAMSRSRTARAVTPTRPFELVAVGAVHVSEKPLTAVLSGGVETMYSRLSVAHTVVL